MNQKQGYVVPKGVTHRTIAPEKTVILMIETAGIVPTGDAEQRKKHENNRCRSESVAYDLDIFGVRLPVFSLPE